LLHNYILLPYVLSVRKSIRAGVW